MCEVTVQNFNEIFSELEANLKNSRFVSIDTEFSCLNVSRKVKNSLFDSGNERYAKLRTTVEQMIPLQIGLTAFTFDPDNHVYTAHIYTFYVYPRSFMVSDRAFVCRASSLQFLSSHKFDFNKVKMTVLSYMMKLIGEGIPYMNRIQEQEMLEMMKKNAFTIFDSSTVIDTENIIEENGTIVSRWIYNANLDDELILKDLQQYKNNLEVSYFLHTELRTRFKNLWTFEDEEGFKVKKTSPEEYAKLHKSTALDEVFISNLLGFSRVFRLLTSLQKPLIGHNLMLDIMVMIHHFEQALPKSYTAYKKLAHRLFPTIYDTKTVSFEISRLISKEKRWQQNTLQSLYEYFKDGFGRHMALNSPLIEPSQRGTQNFHYAGWDSYCTGYIFIRMAHIYAAQRYNINKKKFMSVELLQAISRFKNSINIIRAHVSHIQLDGEDPVSQRPSWLIAETIRNAPLNISRLTSLLMSYGFVEVKPYYSFRGNRAIIAVDNFGSATRIIQHFKKDPNFKIQHYSFIKHSSKVKVFAWSTIVASGAFWAWFCYSKAK